MGRALQKPVFVSCASAYFPAARKQCTMPPGLSLLEILMRLGLPERYILSVRMALQGEEVPRLWWGKVRPKPGCIVEVAVAPTDAPTPSEKAERARMAVMLFATAAGQAVGGAAGGLIGGLVGSWAITKLIPVPEVESLANNTPSIGGIRNDMRQLQAVPRIYGRMRTYPPLAAVPYTEVCGNDQYLNCLFAVGYKPLALSDFKIGEMDIDAFLAEGAHREPGEASGGMDGLTIEVDAGYDDLDDKITIYPTDVEETTVDRLLQYVPNFYVSDTVAAMESHGMQALSEEQFEKIVTFTTPADTKRISMDFVWPQGLFKQDGSDTFGWHVDLQVRYRPVGASGTDADQRTWQFAIPSDAINIYDDVRTFTDEWLFQALVRFNNFLDDVLAVVETIAGGSWLMNSALHLFMGGRVSDVKLLTDQRKDGDDLTVEQKAILTDTSGILGQFSNVLSGVQQTSTEIGTNLARLNALMSVSTWVMNAIDGVVRLNEYRQRGYAPPVEAMKPTQSLMVQLLGNGYLFEERDPGAFTIATDAEHKGFLRRNLSWDVEPGQYVVEVRRDSTDSATDDDIHDEVYLHSYRCHLNTDIVSDAIRDKVALVALRVRASDKLNNVLDRFNVMAESPLPWHDGVSWQSAALVDSNGYSVSRNPAWVFCDVLRGNANPAPVSDDTRLDLTTIRAWAEECHETLEFRPSIRSQAPGGYHFDGIFERNTTVQEALRDVCRVAKASPTVRDGKFSVIRDRVQDSPVALITPRNSADFRSTKLFSDPIHALRIKYVNAEAGWVVDEMMVYNDGYGPPGSGLTAPTNIEDIEFFGLVDTPNTQSVHHTDQVRRLGRYLIACHELRPEVFEVTMDLERIVFERGDLVRVQHDVSMWGHGTGRVTSITRDMTYVFGVYLDEDVTMEADKSYAARIRATDGRICSVDLVTNAGTSNYLEFSSGVAYGDAEDTQPAYEITTGCLVAFGESNTETIECIVTEIRPMGEQTARIYLVEAAPAVHAAESEAIPDYDPQVTYVPKPQLATPPRPHIQSVHADETALRRLPDGSFEPRIKLRMRYPDGTTKSEQEGASLVDGVQLRFREHVPDMRARATNQTPWLSFETKDKAEVLYVTGVEEGKRYDVSVRSLTRFGVCSEWAFQFQVLITGASNPPPAPQRLKYSGGHLEWEYENPPVDHAGFRVKILKGVSPTSCRWAKARSCHDGVIKTNRFYAAQMFSGRCTLLVKAVDLFGNESAKAAALEVARPEVDVLGTEVSRTDVVAGQGRPTSALSNMADVSGPAVEAESGDKDGFYCDDGDFPLYRAPSDSFYARSYPQCYLVGYVWPGIKAGTEALWMDHDQAISCEVECSGDSPDYHVEYKNEYARLWPYYYAATLDKSLNAVNVWPDDLQQDFWPAEMDWQAYRDALTVIRPFGRKADGTRTLDEFADDESGTLDNSGFVGTFDAYHRFHFRVIAAPSNQKLKILQFDIVEWSD